MNLKLLIYCTKGKPYLFNENIYENYDSKYITSIHGFHKDKDYLLNGKIVAECDFEVEEIYLNNNVIMGTKTLNSYDLVANSKVEIEQMRNYLKGENGYAIHLKNLHIFDKPKSLSLFSHTQEEYNPITKAPQNMCYAFDSECRKYIVMSTQPQWVALILNGLKTIEVRRKVLKEMI